MLAVARSVLSYGRGVLWSEVCISSPEVASLRQQEEHLSSIGASDRCLVDNISLRTLGTPKALLYETEWPSVRMDFSVLTSLKDLSNEELIAYELKDKLRSQYSSSYIVLANKNEKKKAGLHVSPQ